jgi:uncharacterized protein
MAFLNHLFSYIMVHAIKLYQLLFAARRQYPRCKYFPSCSEYMILAIQKHGVLVGVVLGIWRLIRCNPFAQGGLDLP